ncbi:MAG: glycosyltransferase [Cyclobacteriaceae bacterium]
MTSKTPLVSVIVPTFNRANLIGETIQSVIAQTYSHWELIIMDDGSSDGTQDVVDSFHDVRIFYFWNPHNTALGAVRNLGIQKAKGQLIAFLDSDDIWRSDKLDVQVNLLNEYEEASFVFSNGNEFGEDATTPHEKEDLFIGNVFLDQLLHKRFCFFSPSLIFKKDVIATTGYIDESFSTSTDIYFFYKMAFHFKGIFTNERLVSIRRQGPSDSTKNELNSYNVSLSKHKEFLESQMINANHFSVLQKECYYKMGLVAIKLGERSVALNSFFNFILLSPLNPKGWIRLIQSLTV